MFMGSVGERGIVTCKYLHFAKGEMSEFRQPDYLQVCLINKNVSYSDFI